jgi:hypothetical protein
VKPFHRNRHLDPQLQPNPTSAVTSATAAGGGFEAIQFIPGPLSSLSPSQDVCYAVPGFEEQGRVDLYGEDGVCSSELLRLAPPTAGNFSGAGFEPPSTGSWDGYR